MTRQGVLWDMDGVLVDTGEAHFQSWARVFSEYDIPFTREFFRATFGMNNAGLLSMLLGDQLTPALLAEIADRKEQLFRDAVRGSVEPMPGVVPWLARLKAADFRQGIASSAPVANIDALMDELGLRIHFDAIISGVDLPGKPEPLLFLKVASILRVPPERCIVVEDAVAGVEAAVRAGMKCIAVTTTNPATALGAADIVVERLDHLSEDAFGELLVEGSSSAGPSLPARKP
jgi:HAD superfamily hydrolase (TIGR01509 family)